MPPLSQLNVFQLLLLTPLLAHAQQPPAPPFQLDEHGEAHFNIPVVVKLAPSVASLSAASVAIHRRGGDDDNDNVPSTDNTSNQASPAADGAEQEVAAPQYQEGRIHLAPPAYIDPDFEVTHQGLDSLDSDDYSDDEIINKRADIALQAVATHTIILVETTGIVTSTQHQQQDSSNAQNTTTTGDAWGKLPLPMNHTSFPLRNGTNSTLPCNGTDGAVVKPTGTGGLKGSGPSSSSGTTSPPLYNPANVGGSNNKGPGGIKGAAARLRVIGGGGGGTEVAAVVLAAVVGLTGAWCC